MADQVTISTFLELRDNLSEGMRKAAAAVEATTGRVRKARSEEEKAAAQAAKQESRIAEARWKDQQRMIVQQERAAAQSIAAQIKAMKAADAMLKEQERDRAKTQAALRRSAEENVKAEVAAKKARDAESRRLNADRVRQALAREKENERAVARAHAESDRALARSAKMRQRNEERAARAAQVAAAHSAREQERYQTKLTAAIWREEQRRIRMAERLASREIAESKRAADAAIREARRAEREKERIARRAAIDARRAAVPAEKEKGGKGLFGTLVGANLAADLVSRAATMGLSAIKGFYRSAVDAGQTYETQVSSISSTLFTMGMSRSFSQAKDKALDLIGTMRSLAAKLPGEAADYVKVFSLTLPSALNLGLRDIPKYADMVSKYTAVAIQRGYKSQAGYQLNEMLQGHVRVTTNMFQALRPYMQMTAKEFNAIKDSSKRMEVVFNAISQASSGLPATAKDASTIFGTLNSALDTLKIVGQFPLFESMKIAATKLTEIFQGPGLGTFVSQISTALGDLTVGAVVFFKFMFDQAAKFASWIGEKLSQLPGFGTASSIWSSIKEAVAFIDPISTMLKIGAEERQKWRSMEAADITRSGRPRPHFGAAGETPTGELRGAPSTRPQQTFDFRNSRFDIKQEFAEGFDPDRIAVAFANDLGRLGDMKLQAAYGTAAGVR